MRFVNSVKSRVCRLWSRVKQRVGRFWESTRKSLRQIQRNWFGIMVLLFAVGFLSMIFVLGVGYLIAPSCLKEQNLECFYEKFFAEDGEGAADRGRNLVLWIGFFIGALLTVWRIKIADSEKKIAEEQKQIAAKQTEEQRQIAAKQTEEQKQIAAKQNENALLSRRDERYQKSTEMLGSAILALRVGGITALDGLARENTGEEAFCKQVVETLSAFVRYPTVDKAFPDHPDEQASETQEAKLDKGSEKPKKMRPDVEKAVKVLARIGEREDLKVGLRSVEVYPGAGAKMRKREVMRVDLHGATLAHGDFPGVNFSRFNLIEADLSGTVLWEADLREAILRKADLRKAFIVKASLVGAFFEGADLREANFSGKLTLAEPVSGELTSAEPISGKPTSAEPNSWWPNSAEPVWQMLIFLMPYSLSAPMREVQKDSRSRR